VKFTNVEKIFWPREGYTKADVIAYYDAVAEVLLPQLRGRPLIMERYPDGIAEKYFLQKDALAQHTPDWMLPHIHEVSAPEAGRKIRYIVSNDRAVLLYLANYAAITLHPWSSRIQLLDYPDYVLLDLDPIEAPFATVQKVALGLKAVLDELKLCGYAKTSGGEGIHVYLPVIEKTVTYGEATTLARALSVIVAERLPELVTIERNVKKRPKGAVYLDYLQNGRGKTLASAYSLRARPNAPVSTPLRWTELKKPIDPSQFNIETVPKRIKTVGDLFEPVPRGEQDVQHLVRALSKRMPKTQRE
jgi:bifunctional non-homologous end joining protein LigD